MRWEDWVGTRSGLLGGILVGMMMVALLDAGEIGLVELLGSLGAAIGVSTLLLAIIGLFIVGVRRLMGLPNDKQTLMYTWWFEKDPHPGPIEIGLRCAFILVVVAAVSVGGYRAYQASDRAKQSDDRRRTELNEVKKLEDVEVQRQLDLIEQYSSAERKGDRYKMCTIAESLSHPGILVRDKKLTNEYEAKAQRDCEVAYAAAKKSRDVKRMCELAGNLSVQTDLGIQTNHEEATWKALADEHCAAARKEAGR